MLLAPAPFDVFIMFKGNSSMAAGIINNALSRMHYILLYLMFSTNLARIYNNIITALKLSSSFRIYDEIFGFI